MELAGLNIKFVPGVGEKRASLLEQEMGIQSYEDMLYYIPYKYIDRTRVYTIRELTSDLPYIQVKAKIAAKFLADGDKVKVGLRFRGRERDYAAKGMDVMNTFAEAVSDVGVVEKKPVFEGRNLTMFLGPKSDK